MKFFKNVVLCSILSGAYHLIGLAKDFYLSQYLAGKEFRDAFVQSWSVINTFRSLISEATLSKIFVPIFARTKVPVKKVLYISIVGTVCFSGLIFFLGKTGFLLKAFAPKAAKMASNKEFAYFYNHLFLCFPLLVLAAFFGVFGLMVNNLWQMPGGPLTFNLLALAGVFAVLKFGSTVKVLCYFLVFAAFAKTVFRFLAMYFSLKSNSALLAQEDLGKALAKVGKSNVLWLTLIAVLRWAYRISLVWLGSFLPKGQITILYFCHKMVDSTFPIFCAGIDNWILVKFSRGEGQKHNFWQTFKLAALCIAVVLVLMLLLSKIFVVKFFPNCPDLFFAWKVAVLVIFGGALGALTRVLRAFFYSKLAYKALFWSNLIEVLIDTVLSLIATFYCAPNGVLLVGSTATALLFSLACSLFFAIRRFP